MHYATKVHYRTEDASTFRVAASLRLVFNACGIIAGEMYLRPQCGHI